MEDSAPFETKTFTIPVKLFEETQLLSNDVILDKVSELVLEYFEDGKYAYSTYQQKNKQVPEVHRQYKGKVKRFLETLTTSKTFKGKVFMSFFQFLLCLDETVITDLIKRNAELRAKTRKQSQRLKELEPLYEDLKNNFDIKIECEMQKEIQRRLNETMKEEREHTRQQLKERLNIINKLEQEITKLQQYHTTDEERLIGDNVRLIEEITKLKKELEKKNIGRPKLSKKEKKKLKKEKLKKQLEELESSSESESESE